MVRFLSNHFDQSLSSVSSCLKRIKSFDCLLGLGNSFKTNQNGVHTLVAMTGLEDTVPWSWFPLRLEAIASIFLILSILSQWWLILNMVQNKGENCFFTCWSFFSAVITAHKCHRIYIIQQYDGVVWSIKDFRMQPRKNTALRFFNTVMVLDVSSYPLQVIGTPTHCSYRSMQCTRSKYDARPCKASCGVTGAKPLTFPQVTIMIISLTFTVLAYDHTFWWGSMTYSIS